MITAWGYWRANSAQLLQRAAPGVAGRAAAPARASPRAGPACRSRRRRSRGRGRRGGRSATGGRPSGPGVKARRTLPSPKRSKVRPKVEYDSIPSARSRPCGSRRRSRSARAGSRCISGRELVVAAFHSASERTNIAPRELRHPRGVVEVQVGHDHELDLARVDAARAQLRGQVLAGLEARAARTTARSAPMFAAGLATIERCRPVSTRNGPACGWRIEERRARDRPPSRARRATPGSSSVSKRPPGALEEAGGNWTSPTAHRLDDHASRPRCLPEAARSEAWRRRGPSSRPG